MIDSKQFTNPASKEDWLSKAREELDPKSPDDLMQEWVEGIWVSPFYHADDREGTCAPLVNQAGGSHWESGCYFMFPNEAAEADNIISALEGGAEALSFMIPDGHVPDWTILDKVDFRYISTHLNPMGTDPSDMVNSFHTYCRQRFGNTNEIRGSVECDPSKVYTRDDKNQFYRYMDTVTRLFPAFTAVAIDGRKSYNSGDNSSKELAEILRDIWGNIEWMLDRHGELKEPGAIFKVQLNLTCHFFIGVIKLRALSLLWDFMMEKLGMEVSPRPQWDVYLVSSSSRNMYHTIIERTTQTVSSVLGGADRIFFDPPEGLDKTEQAELERISRNITHILRFESHIDEVADPLAGSYFIEELSDEVARQAWSQFTGQL